RKRDRTSLPFKLESTSCFKIKNLPATSDRVRVSEKKLSITPSTIALLAERRPGGYRFRRRRPFCAKHISAPTL
ncbi:MAG: hypothetical protein AABN95_26595, partial [Acidobacteriota bacterium]